MFYESELYRSLLDDFCSRDTYRCTAARAHFKRNCRSAKRHLLNYFSCSEEIAALYFAYFHYRRLFVLHFACRNQHCCKCSDLKINVKTAARAGIQRANFNSFRYILLSVIKCSHFINQRERVSSLKMAERCSQIALIFGGRGYRPAMFKDRSVDH